LRSRSVWRPFNGVFAMPPSLAPTFLELDIAGAFNAGLIAVVLTFFLVELFDATGTLIGVSHRAGLLDAEGKLPRLKRALLADSTAIAAGSCSAPHRPRPTSRAPPARRPAGAPD
jgi:AGZA family xanthine/uracil permease-like MFS transporter